MKSYECAYVNEWNKLRIETVGEPKGSGLKIDLLKCIA